MLRDSFENWLMRDPDASKDMLKKKSNGKYKDNGVELLKTTFIAGVDWSRKHQSEIKGYSIVNKKTNVNKEYVVMDVVLHTENPIKHLKNICYELYNDGFFKKGSINFYLPNKKPIWVVANFEPELKIKFNEKFED